MGAVRLQEDDSELPGELVMSSWDTGVGGCCFWFW